MRSRPAARPEAVGRTMEMSGAFVADASAPTETIRTGWDFDEHIGGHSRTRPPTPTLLAAGSAEDERSRPADLQPFIGLAFAYGRVRVHGTL